MKNLAFSLCLLFAVHSYSQEFTSAAAQEPQLDEFGNFLNNSTDKKGQKQGDWFYLDVFENQLIKQVYADDICKSTHINIRKEWVDIKDLTITTKYNEGAIKALKDKGVELNENRQILVILGTSGEFIQGKVIGDWPTKDEVMVLSILNTYFFRQKIESSTKLFILL